MKKEIIYTCAMYKGVNSNNTYYIDLNNQYTFTVSRDEIQLKTYPTFQEALTYIYEYLKIYGKTLERI